MSYVKRVFLLLAVGSLLTLQFASLRAQSCDAVAEEKEEDCLDAIMHPDLASNAINGRRMLSGEETNAFWLQRSKELLRQRVQRTPNVKIAKNVILFLGDGMGLTTLAAARNLLGGEEQQLAFENFPAVGLSKTYSVDKIVPDSGCTATAYLCGIKGNYGTIGVNGNVARKDCAAMARREDHVNSIAKWAMDAGKTAGLVTTTRVTHASPAGIYAHTADRDWENDVQLKQACGKDTKLKDIALQMIDDEVGSKLKVILGGGKAEFVDKSSGGHRGDGRNLIEEYLKEGASNSYVETLMELEETNAKAQRRLLGLFHKSHMDYHLDAKDSATKNQPTLAEMTRKALEFMQEGNANGYFLFVEGGRIDSAHHETSARLALDETIEFSKAVEVARNMTNEEETLIVVTADHSHTFSLAGYQSRGSDIYGPAPVLADDDQPYLALSYANGPSFDLYYNTKKHSRRDPVEQLSDSDHATFPATVPLNSETHGGEDVAVYALGPWAELFTGVYDQHTIPHLMAYAACLGDGLKACT